jgi:hypothetical protein
LGSALVSADFEPRLLRAAVPVSDRVARPVLRAAPPRAALLLRAVLPLALLRLVLASAGSALAALLSLDLPRPFAADVLLVDALLPFCSDSARFLPRAGAFVSPLVLVPFAIWRTPALKLGRQKQRR